MAKPRWGRDIDEWVARIFAEDENDLPDDDPWGRVEHALTLAWPRALELGVDVVLDFGFWPRAQRDTTRRITRSAPTSRTSSYGRLVPTSTSSLEPWLTRQISRTTTP